MVQAGPPPPSTSSTALAQWLPSSPTDNQAANNNYDKCNNSKKCSVLKFRLFSTHRRLSTQSFCVVKWFLLYTLTGSPAVWVGKLLSSAVQHAIIYICVGRQCRGHFESSIDKSEVSKLKNDALSEEVKCSAEIIATSNCTNNMFTKQERRKIKQKN